MKVEMDAENGRKGGMTLAEVERFCRLARESGATGADRVGGAVSVSGKQYRLSVKFDGKPEEPA